MRTFAKLGEDDDGRPKVRVRLSPSESEKLLELGTELRDILTDPRRSPRVIDRLFPPAFDRDPAAEAAHKELLKKSLYEERLVSLGLFEETLKRGFNKRNLYLEGGEPDLWLHVINDLRLLLATELDVQDNDWADRFPESAEDLRPYSLLLWLTDFQERFLGALRG